MVKWLAVSMGVLTACSGGPCAARVGTYSWQMKVRSGDCGDFSEKIFTSTGNPTGPTPPCTGSITYSEDECKVTHDEVCPVAADGGTADGTFSVRGVIWWDGAGDSATGLLEYELDTPDPADGCEGTYDATYKKL
jgi:hypothetical protein